MPDTLLSAVFIVLYVAVQLAIGVWVSRRVSSETDYFVGGRRLGVAVVAISVFANFFGAETILASSGIIASDGLAGGRAEPFGYALCLLAMALLIASAFRARGYVTLGDFFRERFGRWAELASVWLTIPVSLIWAAAQLIALSVLMKTALGVPEQATLLAAVILVATYTVFGGMLSDVATDVVQSIVLIVGLGAALVALAGWFGGFSPMFAVIEPNQLSIIGEGESWLARLDVWAIPILGSLITQETVSRFLAAKDPETARRGGIIAAGLYLAVGVIPVIIGLAGAHVAGLDAEGDEFFPSLVQLIANPVVFVFFAGALLSAILSTVNSNILSVSSLISVNLLAGYHARASERQRLWFARAMTVTASFIAYAIAAGGASIRDLITMTSVLGQAGLLVAVLIGLRSRFGGEAAALGAVAACILANIATLVVYPLQKGESLALLLAGEASAPDGYFLYSVLAALLGYIAVAWWEARAKSPPPAPTLP
ncbi:MAG: sodium:solute symporter [Hydrogenophilaceae bacterium]|jgi:Na+/proline symporter|nr:sodium:solute symporter [Hydrogenophilaceae bacterium]